jgi:hypothetical protein
MTSDFQNTYFQYLFPDNRAICEIIWENIVAGKATDDK